MGTTRKGKGLLFGAFVAASLLVAAPAEAATRGTWSQDPWLDGYTSWQFGDICRNVYGGTPVFDGNIWMCELPGGGMIACEQGPGGRAQYCRRYTPKSYVTSTSQPLSIGPTTFSR